jgi:hypothetical protein
MATGKSGSIELEQAMLRAMQRNFEMFVQKNHDYGADNIAHGGLVGVVVRVGDKAARLWNMIVKHEAAYVDESLVDTLMDMANYAYIAKMLVDGSWPAPKDAYPFSRAALINFLVESTEEPV